MESSCSGRGAVATAEALRRAPSARDRASVRRPPRGVLHQGANGEVRMPGASRGYVVHVPGAPAVQVLSEETLAKISRENLPSARREARASKRPGREPSVASSRVEAKALHEAELSAGHGDADAAPVGRCRRGPRAPHGRVARVLPPQRPSLGFVRVRWNGRAPSLWHAPSPRGVRLAGRRTRR
jgi:hypothetical protein